ncbi:hypothetical protein [Lancefieldella rimae]
MDSPKDIADIINLWQDKDSRTHITFRDELKETGAYLIQLFRSGIPGKILASAFILLFLSLLIVLFGTLYYDYSVFDNNFSATPLALSVIVIICFLVALAMSVAIMIILNLDKRGIISLPKVKDIRMSDVEYLDYLTAHTQIDVIFLDNYCSKKLKSLEKSIDRADRYWTTIIMSVFLGTLVPTISPVLSFIFESYKQEDSLRNLPLETLISAILSFFFILITFIILAIAIYMLGFFIIHLWFKYVRHRNAYQSLSEAIASYKIFNFVSNKSTT